MRCFTLRFIANLVLEREYSWTPDKVPTSPWESSNEWSAKSHGGREREGLSARFL